MDKVTQKINPQVENNKSKAFVDIDTEKCNCKDKFRTTLCPVHDVPKNSNIAAYGEKKAITLTDQHILSPRPQNLTWTGHVFMCFNCSNQIVPSFNYCWYCGTKINIESNIVTNYLNELSQRNNQQYK